MDEIITLRTETSKTFDRGGVKRRLHAYAGAIHYKDNYQDKSESWKDIDLTWEKGVINKAPYILSIVGNQITFRDKKTDSVATLKPSLLGVNPANLSNFTIEPFNAGFRLKRVIQSARDYSDASFEIDVQGKGISVISSAYDADGRPIPVLSEIKNGELVERIDASELAKAKFPITIDPNLTVQPSGKDTYLRQNVPNSNYGSTPELYLNQYTNNRYRSILEFIISAIPEGQNLTAASLGLYYWGYVNSPPTYIDPVGKVVWTYKQTHPDIVESQATWNSYKNGSAWTNPGGDFVIDDPAGGSTTFPAGYDWMIWNILAIAQDAYAGSIPLELLVKFETENVANNASMVYFYSNNYAVDPSKCPYVSIDYEPAAAPQSIAPASVAQASALQAPAIAGSGSAPITPSPAARPSAIQSPVIAGSGAAPITSLPVARPSAVQAPVISGSGAAPITIVPTAVNTSIQAPALAGSGSAPISPAAIAAISALRNPVLSGSGAALILSPYIAGASTVRAPGLSGSGAALILLSPVVVASGIFPPVIATILFISPSSIAAISAVYTPSITGSGAALILSPYVTGISSIRSPGLSGSGAALILPNPVAVASGIFPPAIALVVVLFILPAPIAVSTSVRTIWIWVPTWKELQLQKEMAVLREELNRLRRKAHFRI